MKEKEYNESDNQSLPLGGDREGSEVLWNANYNRVMLTNFTLYFSFYLLTPLLPLYLSETFHSTKDMIGLVLSGYTLIALIIRPFSGFLVDSFPRKRVLMVCVFFYFLFFGGYLVAGALVLFTVIRTLHGGLYGASTVASSTIAIDVLPSSRRNEGIGYYGLSNNVASAIAPTVGIMIYQYIHNFQVLFWVAFISAGFGLLMAHGIKTKERPLKRQKIKFSLDRFFLSRGWFLALNMCCFGFCWGLLSNYLAIYGKERLGITGGTGTYFMILSAGLILSRLQGVKALREGKMLHNALEGVILSTLGYTIFILLPSLVHTDSLILVGYYLSAILIGFGNGHIWPAFQNMIISIAQPNERGTANSTLLTSWDLGMGVGILAGGAIAEFFGYTSMFWVNTGIHMAGLAVFILITMRLYNKVQIK